MVVEAGRVGFPRVNSPDIFDVTRRTELLFHYRDGAASLVPLGPIFTFGVLNISGPNPF